MTSTASDICGNCLRYAPGGKCRMTGLDVSAYSFPCFFYEPRKPQDAEFWGKTIDTSSMEI
ncbi:MAG TPA: hypothetical protein PK409_08510 [Thermosynergistes sp.]|nr:hypothetical protein [Thermosynergistes sp.]HQE21959.1 hypothetical protein [Thermosynergistes sp.]